MTDIDTWEWFGNRTFHHSQFEPPARLRTARERLGRLHTAGQRLGRA